MIDLHTHLIPDLDDGSKSIKDTIEMVTLLYNLGFRKFFLTPHFRPYTFDVDKEKTKLGFKLLKKTFSFEKDIEFFLGNEVFITYIEKSTDYYSLNESKYILMELPTIHYPFDYLLKVVKEFNDLGKKLIIAHPERSVDLRKDSKNYLKKLIDNGVQFQLNIGSFSGQYGFLVKWFAISILKNYPVIGFGSDSHNIETMKKYLPSGLKNIEKLIGQKNLLNKMNHIERELIHGT